MLTRLMLSQTSLVTLISRLGLATAMLVTIAPLHAQPIDCQNATTQSAMNLCAAADWQKTDQTLNKVYKSLLAKLTPVRRDQLTAIQLDWITFRDRECAFISGAAEGGSIQPLLKFSCLNRLTSQRTTDLQAYLQGKNPAAPGGNYWQMDADLNQRYQQIKKDREPRQQQRLEAASLAWIRWRDRVCDFEQGYGGKAATTACLKRLTLERIQQFKNY